MALNTFEASYAIYFYFQMVALCGEFIRKWLHFNYVGTFTDNRASNLALLIEALSRAQAETFLVRDFRAGYLPKIDINPGERALILFRPKDSAWDNTVPFRIYII